MDEVSDFLGDEPVELEVNGVLDLHPFQPKEIVSVVEEYLRVCLEKRIDCVRIIHGKGKGVQRDRVQAFLKKHPNVVSFGPDSAGGSSWGATIARLRM